MASANSSPLTSVDLSTYTRIGRYDLPEPTRTAAPANSLLAQEVSAVTYNPDTDTLFVVGDGSTSIVQVSKTGQLIDSMTLAPGNSPQGTEFYDTEGLTYVGGGKFVMAEERDRQAVLFTYVAGGTLTRSAVQTVKLGTTIGNIGIEGISYDPQTGGFIAVKETQPEGIFQTGIDFAAGTATNGSPTTVNSTNLFDPALTGLLDFADIFSLSNLTSLNGQADSSHLLVLSQESGKIVEVDRSGNIFSSLTIVSDPGNPLSVPDQQHEGLTMDNNGILYVTSENGGGDFDHPQLWVYAPSTVPNQAPTAVVLNNQVTAIAENTAIPTRRKVADIAIADDGLGTNNLTVTGTDASFFEVDSNGLYLKAGTVLDYETKTSYSVTVNVDDPTVGSTPDVIANFILAVTDVVNELPPQPSSLIISEVAPWSSGNSPVAADWFEVTNAGASPLNLSGWKIDDNSNSFGSAVALNGVTTIAPRESAIFIETANLASVAPTFLSTWFGANPPAGLQIGSYSGAGVGLSTAGDAVNLYDSSGVLQANVSFGASPTGTFPSFNNAAGLNNTTISQLSAVDINGAFAAVNDPKEIGSPGTVGKLFISEVAPWSSGNSPVAADWFEVTNTSAFAADITGWKIDDNSGSFAAAVALSGITSIAPGESVIFLETANLASAKTAFLNTWFGANPPAGLQIGSYSGSGVGLSTAGDAVNLYNSSGVLQANVSFGASPAAPFSSFNNAAAQNNATISQLSVVGVNGGFVAANDANEIGSPGAIANAKQAAKNDFNGDGKTDIVVRNYATGENAFALMDDTVVTQFAFSTPVPDLNWTIDGAGDFNKDGKSDVVLRNKATGENAIALMNGTVLSQIVNPTILPDPNWSIGGVGDFNRDGNLDLLYRNKATGENTFALMNGTSLLQTVVAQSVPDLNWEIGGVGDFNKDGKDDVLFRNKATGENTIALMNGTELGQLVSTPILPDLNWSIGSVGDYNRDGNTDILFHNQGTGQNTFALMNGTNLSQLVPTLTVADTNWAIGA
jgi:uncharacterized protein YjiK